MNGIPIPCRSSSAQTYHISHYPHSTLSSFVCSYILLFFHSYREVEGGALLKGGFLADAGDEGGGVIGSIISLVLLSGGLIALCTLLKLIFMSSKAKTALKDAVKLNDYASILIDLWRHHRCAVPCRCSAAH